MRFWFDGITSIPWSYIDLHYYMVSASSPPESHPPPLHPSVALSLPLRDKQIHKYIYIDTYVYKIGPPYFSHWHRHTQYK